MKNPVESNKIIVLLSLIQLLFFCTYVSADIVSIGTGGEEISLSYGSQVDLFFAGSDIIYPTISILSPVDGYKIYDYVSGSVFLFIDISVIDINLDSCWYEVVGTEQDNRYDANDIESLVSKYSVNGTITKVEMVGVGTWKENAYGDKGFNEAELKSKECSHEGSTYDSKLNDCVEITEDAPEEPVGELGI